MKVGIFAKGPACEPATSEDFARRASPPTARAAFVGLGSSAVSGARRRPRSRRPGLGGPTALGVPGDGAEWIRNEATEQSPGAVQVLDVYHAGEPGDRLAAIHGETAGATSWWRASRRRLVGDGWWGPCERIGATLVTHPTAACQAAMDGLTTYFSGHGADELRPSARDGPVDRRRDGRGGGQAVDRQAIEADRGQVEGGQRTGDGRIMLDHLRFSLVDLLGGRLTARIHWRTQRSRASDAGPSGSGRSGRGRWWFMVILDQ